MTDRDTFLRTIRDAVRSGDRTPAALPDWDPAILTIKSNPDFEDAWELFAHKMSLVHGTPLRGWNKLAEFLREANLQSGYADPILREEMAAAGGFEEVTFETIFDAARVDDYQFGITRAAGIIVESGSIVLKDGETSSRLAALAPWAHIAVVRRAQFYQTLAQAIADFGDDPNIVFATGPSKTADIESVMIEGVHGPGVQVCVLVD